MQLFQVTKEQFFKIFPPCGRNITIDGKIVAMLGDEVICDDCNRDCFTEEMTTVFLLTYDDKEFHECEISRAICQDCGTTMIKEHNGKKA